jgi:hypothetical protein
MNSDDIDVPTYGILNQIHVGEGVPKVSDWNSFYLDPTVGINQQQAVDLFRVNMGLVPLYNPGGTYYRSNVFYAPYVPYRTIWQHVTLQASDPLVHFTLSDLIDLSKTNNVDFIAENPLLRNMGRISDRYDPWGGYMRYVPATAYNAALKDPLVRRSDDWDFPENSHLDVEWMGRVHRGTPWQTIYLKSASVDPVLWRNRVGVSADDEAKRLQPTNDWRLAGLLTGLFNTNDPRSLVSVNGNNDA